MKYDMTTSEVLTCQIHKDLFMMLLLDDMVPATEFDHEFIMYAVSAKLSIRSCVNSPITAREIHETERDSRSI